MGSSRPKPRFIWPWQKNKRDSLRAAWGSKPEDRRLDEDVLQSVADYHLIRREYDKPLCPVDDQTWQDLQMDQLFWAMNHTSSVVGGELLYDMLRDTGCSQEELAERADIMAGFEEDEETRLDCQTLFQKMGKAAFHGAARFLYMPDFQSPPRPWLIKLLAVMPIVILLAALFYLPLIVLLLPQFLVNLVIHYRNDLKYGGSLNAVRHMARVVNAGCQFTKMSAPWLVDQVLTADGYTAKLRSLARWLPLFSMERVNAVDIMTEYIKIAFLLDSLSLCQISRKLKESATDIRGLYRLLGTLDALCGVASWRCGQKLATPQFVEDRRLSVTGVRHPMLENAVPNDFDWVNNTLITGSNASGKSTFVKAIAINAILAQSLYLATADAISLCRSQVMCAMAARDNLQQGESYYVVEVKALKRIIDAVGEEGPPILCCVDEILRGTNTVERIAASCAVLQSFVGRNMLCLNATHDRELTQLLGRHYDNVHFREEVQDGRMVFSYRLRAGAAEGRNAIRLLDILGFDKAIVDNAEAMAARFDSEGHWPQDSELVNKS